MRFRLHDRRLPGTPDIVMAGARLAVFLDGCFWHACPLHGSVPKNNHEWWTAKLDRNVERDCEKDAQLNAIGWHPIHVWEHEDPAAAAELIVGEWRRRAAGKRT
jgi:DNA mismatch endonuclease (patch repair protein)